MTEEEIFSRADKFLRDCIYLKAKPKKKGDKPVAWWGGTLADGQNHWITVKGEKLLKPEGFNVRLSYNSKRALVEELDTSITCQDIEDFKPLYPYPELSWPMLEIIFENSPDWFSEETIQAIKVSGYPTPKAGHPAYAYDRFFGKHLPFSGNEKVYAVIGGWHNSWGHDDWWDLAEEDLLFWTIEGSEPFIELWKYRQGNIGFIERIT